MDYQKIDMVVNSFVDNISSAISFYSPKVAWALLIIILGWFMAIWVYKLILFLFKKFKLIQIIDKLTLEQVNLNDKDDDKKKKRPLLLSQKIKINIIVAKAVSYYIFLVFFRFSIVVIWITEVENFMWDLLAYLPKLFLWLVILFFWIRFAGFIYDLVYHALDIAKQKTAKIIASWAKIIILFFTLMVALHYIDIVDDTIINTILIWFISMLALAWWLAFGLWGKHIAKEILENLKK